MGHVSEKAISSICRMGLRNATMLYPDLGNYILIKMKMCSIGMSAIGTSGC
jgi:hypothetical protein